MDQIKTISLPERRPSLAKSERNGPDDELKIAHLFRLGQHYWPKDFSAGQSKEFLKDYLEDLSGFNAAEVENACRDWRQNAANKRYPRSAELILAARDIRQRKVDAMNPVHPFTGTRPTLWHFQPRERWQPNWKENEIPEEYRRNKITSTQGLKP